MSANHDFLIGSGQIQHWLGIRKMDVSLIDQQNRAFRLVHQGVFNVFAGRCRARGIVGLQM